MKMIRGALRVKRLDFRTNDSVRAELDVTQLTKKLRRKRLQWLGHVQRHDDHYMGKRALLLHGEGTRRRGKLRITLLHMIKVDNRELRIGGVLLSMRDEWCAVIPKATLQKPKALQNTQRALTSRIEQLQT